MAHLVHILGNCEILLANEQKKKGDAGKPALHETLVQMNKEWEGAVRDRREEMQSVASSCHQLSDVRQLSLLSRDSGHIKLSKTWFLDCLCVGGYGTKIQDRFVMKLLNRAISCRSYETQAVWSPG